MILSVNVINYRTVIAFLLSVGLGLALTALLPFLGTHQIMFLALPVVAIFLLMLVINPKGTFILIFLTRPILDNTLNMTKVGVGGQDVGFGAILNLVIILLAVFLFFYEGSFPRRNPVIRVWVIYLAVMLFAAVVSPYFGRGIRLYANYLSYFCMFLVPFLIIKDKKDFIFWLKVFAWSFVVPVIYANIDLVRGGQFYADAGMRIKGASSHPNVLAFYLTLGLTFYFYLIKSGFLKLKRFTLFAMLMLILNMLVLLLATKTRNAWIACFGGLLIYGLLKDRKALLIMFLVMPALLLVPSVKDRVITAMNGKGAAIDYSGMNSFEWRLKMWKSSLPMVAKRPVQGYGLSSFQPMSREFSDVGSNGAHNMYVEALFESGFVGLFSLLALFFQPLIIFWGYMWKSVHRQAVLWAIVVGYLVSYIVICSADNLSYYLALNWYVWFFIAMMMISKRFMDTDKNNLTAPIY